MDLRLIEAREMLRRRHQGHGRPVITLTAAGVRIVVCGKRVLSSPTWRFFPDFLIENLKDTLGRQWGASASKVIPDHPIFRWLRLLQDARNRQPFPAPLPMTGGLSALNRLSYALYLIEHNDKPPRSLIKRLRRPSEFLPACQEALVASAFALAGAAIEGAEEVKSRGSKPEFFASFAAGPRYAVEAKRKSNWKARCDPENAEFVLELRAWLRHRLYSASAKKLANPVFWLELGIGQGITEENGEKVRSLITEAVRDSENLTVEGEPIRPAYVVVTNNADFADDHSQAGLQFGLLMGFAMPDFRGEKLDLETAMQRHDKHRPIRRVVECLVEVQQVPNSFDSVPDELLDDSGQPIEPPKIGSRIEYPGQDGAARTGVIEEITSAWNGTAVAAVCGDEDGERALISIPLTPQEDKAAKKLGDAVFGKPEGPRGESISDP
ncbi:hypothetical protein [Mesorhizobium sp. CA5]|uniref:hypothetical protein n=1 Tax=Mesorhizobium sp. CA5 TaxID=2876638 RepID=UPI001CD12470|nr:hypothetical protein [Mesorhizobium sp. CA5]MBZ9843997.1 hypothetical protein [Mesorhizobium sp. CA5]